jgi:hypothetical protein
MTSMQEIISIHGPPHFGHATCGCLLTFCGKFLLLVGLVQYSTGKRFGSEDGVRWWRRQMPVTRQI